MTIFRKCPSHPTAYQKEVPPQEGQAVASLPSDEAEMGEQVLPISSGDQTHSDVQVLNITHTSYLSVFMFDV